MFEYQSFSYYYLSLGLIPSWICQGLLNNIKKLQKKRSCVEKSLDHSGQCQAKVRWFRRVLQSWVKMEYLTFPIYLCL